MIFPIDELLNKITQDPYILAFNRRGLMLPYANDHEDTKILDSSIFEDGNYFKNQQKCTVVKYPRKSLSRDGKLELADKTVYSILGERNDIYSNNSFPATFRIYLHEESNLPCGSLVDSLEILANSSSDISYSEVSTEFSNYPFCMEKSFFKNIGESKYNLECCIENCLTQTLNRYLTNNTLFHFLTIKSNTFTENLKISNPQRITKFRENFMYIQGTKCRKKCPFACQSRNFKLFRSESKELLFGRRQIKFQKRYYFDLKNIERTTTIFYYPKQNLLDFFIQIASLSSLWLGFVIYDSLWTAINLFVGFYDRRKKKVVKINPIIVNPSIFVFNN